MWTSIQRILKPYQRLHIADLGPFDGVWVTEDAGKAEVLARRFFPTGPTTPEFQSRSDRRRQEVEDWLEEEWEDIPPVTQEEVQRKLLEMRALAAPGPDGIMAQCLQESRSVMVPCLTELFQRMLELGVHPASWKTTRVLPVPKPGADLHSAKGYRPIALLNVLSKVMESLMKDRMVPFVHGTIPRPSAFAVRLSRGLVMQLRVRQQATNNRSLGSVRRTGRSLRSGGAYDSRAARQGNQKSDTQFTDRNDVTAYHVL